MDLTYVIIVLIVIAVLGYVVVRHVVLPMVFEYLANKAILKIETMVAPHIANMAAGKRTTATPPSTAVASAPSHHDDDLEVK